MFVHDLYAFNALHILLNDTVAVIPQLGVEWGKEKCNLLNLFGVQRKEYKPEELGCLVIVNLFFCLQPGWGGVGVGFLPYFLLQVHHKLCFQINTRCSASRAE